MTAPWNPDPTAPPHTTPGPPAPPRAPKSRKRLIIGLSAAAVLIVTLIATAAIGTYVAVSNHNQNVRDEATREKMLNDIESKFHRLAKRRIDDPVETSVRCPKDFPVEPGSQFICEVTTTHKDEKHQTTSGYGITIEDDGDFSFGLSY